MLLFLTKTGLCKYCIDLIVTKIAMVSSICVGQCSMEDWEWLSDMNLHMDLIIMVCDYVRSIRTVSPNQWVSQLYQLSCQYINH